MGTRARPSQLRPAAGVRQLWAREARRTARAAGNCMPPRQRYTWPADKPAIIEQTLAAVRERPVPVLAPAGDSP